MDAIITPVLTVLNIEAEVNFLATPTQWLSRNPHPIPTPFLYIFHSIKAIKVYLHCKS